MEKISNARFRRKDYIGSLDPPPAKPLIQHRPKNFRIHYLLCSESLGGVLVLVVAGNDSVAEFDCAFPQIVLLDVARHLFHYRNSVCA